MRKVVLGVVCLGVALFCGCAAEKEPLPLPGVATGAATSAGPAQETVRELHAEECRRVLRDDAAPESLLQAAERNVEYLSRLPLERRQRLGGREVSVADLLRATDLIKQHVQDLPALCERATLLRWEAAQPIVVTGYYQPELRASRKRTERFRFPLYRTPDDLVDVDLREWCPMCPQRVLQGRVQDGRLVPYYTRREIEAGALAGRGYELAWLDDPIEAYFLHVQGSALLELEDGVHLQVSYAATNGHPYVPLAKILAERAKLSSATLSLRELKAYLRAHPEEQAELFAANPQYVFFRGVVVGPIGSCQVPLTPGRSVAADPAVYPHGAPVFLELTPTNGAGADGRAYRRLVFLQDSGTTVSGGGRLDLYCGSGEVAEAVAASLHHSGTLYFLIPR